MKLICSASTYHSRMPVHLARQMERAGRHEQTILERLAPTQGVSPFEACHKVASRVSSQALVRYDMSSVWTRYCYCDVLVKRFS
jgi:hypothetical protein